VASKMSRLTVEKTASRKLICPSCQSAAAAGACRLTPKHLTICNVPPHQQGAFRDRHERWARDAMDVSARLTKARLTDGEVVWS
jgi:hypothetical protein